MADEQLKQYKMRFEQLLKAQVTPRVPANDHTPKIFNAQGSDVRKHFALNDPWIKLIKEGLLEFEMEGRTISLFLLPDQSNPLSIFIPPIPGKEHGEQMILFLGDAPLTPEKISNILHNYLTDETARTESIKNNPSYLILPKDWDNDDFLLNSTIQFIPESLLKNFKKGED